VGLAYSKGKGKQNIEEQEREGPSIQVKAGGGAKTSKSGSWEKELYQRGREILHGQAVDRGETLGGQYFLPSEKKGVTENEKSFARDLAGRGKGKNWYYRTAQLYLKLPGGGIK